MIRTANTEKAALIAELSAARREQSVQTLVKLLALLIDETRKENDTVLGNDIFINQGVIKGYKQLSEYILRDMPSVAKITVDNHKGLV
jgi:hypothetical protein